MLLKSSIMTSILQAVYAQSQPTTKRILNENTSSADYQSYFDLSNLVGGGWTNTVSL